MENQTPGKLLPGAFVNRIGVQFKAVLQRYCYALITDRLGMTGTGAVTVR